MVEKGARLTALENLYPGRGDTYDSVLAGSLTENGPVYVTNIERRLLVGEKNLDRHVINELKRRSDKACNEPSGFVRQAREELKKFFLDEKYRGKTFFNHLQTNGYALILYGSLQYGDPRNADGDLLGVVERNEQRKRTLELALNEELVDYWGQFSNEQRTRRGDASVWAFALPDSTKSPVALLNEYVEDGRNFNPGDLAPTITGIALFPEDEAQVERLRKKAIKIAESDPMMCAIVNAELEECLQIRLERET